jgi:hypothetical protein
VSPYPLLRRQNGSYSSSSLSGILRAAQHVSGAPLGRLERLSQALLGFPPLLADRCEGRSDLNCDGSPLQLLVSSRASTRHVRLIGDPAFYHADPLARLGRSLEALDAVLDASDALPLREHCLRAIAYILPRDEAGRRKYPTGMIRLAASIEREGAAVYAAPEPAAPDPWERALRWLTETLPTATIARKIVSVLRTDNQLFGIGLAGRESHAARAKLYWRLATGNPTRPFGIPVLDDPAVVAFVRELAARGALPIRALTFSVSLSLRTGEAQDGKVDVCTKSAGIEPARVPAILARTSQALGLSCLPLDATLAALTIGCIGLGTDGRGDRRLNVYASQPNHFEFPMTRRYATHVHRDFEQPDDDQPASERPCASSLANASQCDRADR